MTKHGQIFGIITYDALFKWVLSSETVRPSFFHAFIPGVVVKSSERLDDHMNPHQELQVLRELLNNENTQELVTSLRENHSDLKVHIADSHHDKATEFLKNLLHHFDEIQYSFPLPRYNGIMDFVCRLDNGEFALVEMQIVPEDHWDQRALAYVAAFYGNQLRQKTAWKEIKKVIGVNILGGGKKRMRHWKETPDQYMRHYKFQEQLHQEKPPRYLEGIEVIQYSLGNAPQEVDSQEQKDWLRFLKDAHNMTEEDVKREIKTPAVLEAFDRARLVNLPKEVKDDYLDQEIRFENMSTYITEKKDEARKEGKEEGRMAGILEGKLETAKALRKQGIAPSIIQAATGLSIEDLEKLN